jgi:hypothetical protein
MRDAARRGDTRLRAGGKLTVSDRGHLRPVVMTNCNLSAGVSSLGAKPQMNIAARWAAMS